MKAVIFTHVLYLILIKTFMVKGATKCESKVELRAVMLSCPAKDTGCDDDDPLSQAMKSEESQILKADSSNFETLREEKERGFPSEVKDCKRKLVITLKVKNAGKIPCDDEYIVVDHVFDPVTGGRGRLLSPVVVKLRQEQMMQLYGLQFQRVVNSDPFEEQKSGEKTCSVDPDNPTCGIAMYDGKPIPYSEGFCCSCDAHVNEKRQLSSVSHEDSFLRRDSKQGNARLIRGEKLEAIVNPELVKLKSGSPDEVTDSKKDDCGVFGDPLCWDKVPNFLLENDRKIVCDRNDFIKELCKLRDAETSTENSRTGTQSKKRGRTAKDDAKMATKGGFKKEVAVLRNFFQELHGVATTSPSSLTESYDSPGSRGKRENRRESKKLSLEEKLDRFAGSKKGTSNRRKRLLELSRRRFRKAEEQCKPSQEGQIVVKQFAPGGYLAPSSRTAPPRYFFSHDKSIIDPLGSAATRNTTCPTPPKENDCMVGSQDKTCGVPQESEMFRSSKDDKKNILEEGTYYRRQHKNENNLARKEKYYVGRTGAKMEASRSEGGREAGAENVKESMKEAAKGNTRFNPFGAGERTEEKDNRGNRKEEETIGEVREGSKKMHSDNFKNFLHKSETEKSIAKPKIRNFFTSKNREKQKLRSEIVKSRKMSELNGFAGEKYKEHLKVEEGRIQSEPYQGKKLGENERGKAKFKLGSDLGSLKPQSTERSDASLHSLSKDKWSYENLKKRPQDTPFNVPKDTESNINFNVEIIRNRAPEISRPRYYPNLEEQQMKNRADTSGKLKTATFDSGLMGKGQYLKTRQNPLHRPPSQGYYVLENDGTFPRDVLLLRTDDGRTPELQSRSRFETFDSGNRAKNREAYIYRKAGRRYYVGQKEPNSARSWQTLSQNRGETAWEPIPRGKRHSESVRRHSEGVRHFRRDKTRFKRSASYSFRPARGFHESNLTSRKTRDDLEGRKCQKEAQESCVGKPVTLHFPSSDRENISIASEVFRSGAGRSRSSDEERLLRSYTNAPDYVLEEAKGVLKEKRQTYEQNKQERSRGGQTCDKDVFGEEPAQDTAHCLRFGDLWYSLYMIKQPVVSQIVGVQLFDKRSLSDGTSKWRDLTKGKMIRIGTFLSKAEDELPTMSFTFMGEKSKKVESAIDPDNYFLLIPSHVSDPSKLTSYPQFEGGPAEYLLVQSKDVSSGGECNMVGTSFEAFARQPDRCSKQRGSCLKRQPVDLWREDMEARIRGKRGKYFVENFGNVPNSPVKTYTNLTGEYLALEYYGEYTSTIEIEMKADSNAIVRKGSNAQIPLVYVDGTYPKKTRIILSILNIGLTSSNFRPRLGDCPPDLDPAWCPLEGPLVTIPPQQRHDFKLDLSGALPSGQVLLTVQVLNQLNKQVAERKIIMKRGDRCVCAFHCKCNCIGNLVNGKTCHRLPVEEYRKAGYSGSYPFRGGAAASASESILGNIHVVLFTASYVLLFLGVMKGILGIFFRRIGIAGTRIITGPRELCGYYEYELLGCSVLYDEFGFPIHPTSCQPVQIVSLWLEIIINFFFFFLYPLRGVWFLLWSLPCCRTHYPESDTCPHNNAGECDRKSSRPLLSKTPNPTCVHYNLTTVDSKKAKMEYLPYAAYNGDDDPLEEDDTEFVLQEMKRYRNK